MVRYLRAHNQLLVDIGGFAINLVPFLLYLMLVGRPGTAILNALPFALFYAFRRTALFAIRGTGQHDTTFGWIGLSAAELGLVIGLFGTFAPVIWDVSGALVGIGAAFFPSVQKQFRLTHQHDDERQRSNSFLLLFAVLLMVGVIVLAGRDHPAVGFMTVLVFVLLGAVGFYFDPLRTSDSSKIHLSIPNILLAALLFCSVLLVRIGRSLGQGTTALIGVGLLAAILLAILMAVIWNRPTGNSMPTALRMRMMLFGICADFCAIFSALYLGIEYGTHVYAWVIASYALAFLLGGRLVGWLAEKLPIDRLIIELGGILVGFLLTFTFTTYFIGIFLIRAFASVQNQDAIGDYDQLDTDQNSYMVSYRLMSIAGLTTQFLLWASLLLCAHRSGFGAILADFTFHQTTTQFWQPLLFAQIVITVWASAFIGRTYQLNRPKPSSQKTRRNRHQEESGDTSTIRGDSRKVGTR